MILADLHEAALAAGRRFPLTLGAKGSATIGGLVSTNAGGTQVLRFGHDALAGARDRGGAARRQPVRGADRAQEGQSRLRPQAAADRRRRDARRRHRGEPEAGAGDRRARRGLGRARLGRGGDAAAAPARGELGEAVESFELVPKSALDLVLAHVPGTRAAAGRAARLERAGRGGLAGWRRRLRSALYEALARRARDGPASTTRRSPRARRRPRPSGGCATHLGGREEGRPGRQARHLGRGRARWPAS